VIKKAESFISPKGKKNSGWLCRCDCGNEKIIRGTSLINGVISCGCLRKENVRKVLFIDLTDIKFGKLLVIDYAYMKNNNAYWNCICDCGNTKTIKGSSLRNGNTTSCGCYQSQIRGLNKKKEFGEASFSTVYYHYKRHAITRKLIFELDREYFKELSQQNCYYCGTEPANVQRSKYNNGDYMYNGIDRVNNSLGYTKENTVPCCSICNHAKNNLNQEDFILWIKKTCTYLMSK